MEAEVSLPQEKVREFTDTAVAYINGAVVELRRLFLVEDIIDSIKFGMGMWCLTHIGALFNGMTLVIIGLLLFVFLSLIFNLSVRYVINYLV